MSLVEENKKLKKRVEELEAFRDRQLVNYENQAELEKQQAEKSKIAQEAKSQAISLGKQRANLRERMIKEAGEWE